MFTNKQGFCKQTLTSYVFSALEALFIISENTFLVKIIEKHSKPSFETIFIVVGSFGGDLLAKTRQKRAEIRLKTSKTVLLTFFYESWIIFLMNTFERHTKLSFETIFINE